MALKQHVSLAFLKDMTPSEKTTFGEHVIDGLKANAATFPNLHLTVMQLTTLNTTLYNTTGAARSGDEHAIDMRREAEAAWDAGFRLTASDVDNRAQGDSGIITLSGFSPTAAARTGKPEPDPLTLKEKPSGIPGGIHIKAVPQKGLATAYLAVAAPEEAVIQFGAGAVIIITLASGQQVFAVASTNSDIDITGMPGDMKMHIGARAINSSGAGLGVEAKARSGE